MSAPVPPVEVWVYTEDSSKGAPKVFQRLLPRLFRLVEPSTQTQHLRVALAAGKAAQAMQGHLWKSTKARGWNLRDALVRELATRIVEGAIVVFHHDGDRPWTAGPGAPRHDAQVAELFGLVDKLVRSQHPTRGPAHGAGLLRLVPHYSIEAWLYLHQDKVVKLLGAGGIPPAEARGWILDPSQPRGFDHVDQPKVACPLGDKHNAELADGWPAASALQRSPSLQHTIREWGQDAVLQEKLRSTCGAAAPPAP